MKQSWRSKRIALFLFAGVSAFSAAGASAAGPAAQQQEKAEVRAILARLLSFMKPGHDWRSDGRNDLPCTFDKEWKPFLADEGGTVRKINQRALLSLREVLDPGGDRPEKFCDIDERNRQVKERLRGLSGDGDPAVTTANIGFSYPSFNRDLTRATLQQSGSNDYWFKSGRTELVFSMRKIFLNKENGVWAVQFWEPPDQ